MKAKLLIGGLVSLLAIGTIFHLSTGKCPLKSAMGHTEQGETVKK